MGWTEASKGAVEAEGSRASAGSHGGEVGGRWRVYVGGGGSGEGAGCEEKRDVGIGRDAIYGSQVRVMCLEGRGPNGHCQDRGRLFPPPSPPLPPPSMPLRPPSTPGRPSSARPSTAHTGPASPFYYDRDPQYTYEYDIDEEEEDDDDDESDAGDVFAFGPPPTASSPITPPPPTFDPAGVDRSAPVPGPSQQHPYPRHPYPLSPVESPPSTDSQNQPDHDDAYRLRRLPPTTAVSTPTTGNTGRFTGVSSAISSREVHVSLPTGDESTGGKGKDRPPSTTRSMSFPSVADSASIK